MRRTRNRIRKSKGANPYLMTIHGVRVNLGPVKFAGGAFYPYGPVTLHGGAERPKDRAAREIWEEEAIEADLIARFGPFTEATPEMWAELHRLERKNGRKR